MEHLAQTPEEELWLMADRSDLRKPYATELPYLMQVPDLDGKGLVPGYRTRRAAGHHAGTTRHSLSPPLEQPGSWFWKSGQPKSKRR